MLKVTRPRNLSAEVQLPSSKSISNRALVLAALSGGGIGLLSNVSDCDDTRAMVNAQCIIHNGQCTIHNSQFTIHNGEGARVIDVGAAGTTMRFLTSVLATTPGTYILTGSQRMQQRPIGPLVDALRQLGAEISYECAEGYPPLRICGRQLHGGTLRLAGDVSSQYVSSLLMIAPRLTGALRIELTGVVGSRPYIDMSMSMMRHFGVETRWDDERTISVAEQKYVAVPIAIESDWSAASYWYEIVLLSPEFHETATLHGLFSDSMQGDSAVADIFARLGINTIAMARGGSSEGVMLQRQSAPPARIEWDFTMTPDLAQTVVVACAAKGVAFRFSGLRSLRIKETDRIAALCTELAKLGVYVDVIGDDVMEWAGPDGQRQGPVSYMSPLPGTSIATYDDHRMAMAFAPVAWTLGSIVIENETVVSKSYPRFWLDLQEAGFEAHPLPLPKGGEKGMENG